MGAPAARLSVRPLASTYRLKYRSSIDACPNVQDCDFTATMEMLGRIRRQYQQAMQQSWLSAATQLLPPARYVAEHEQII